MSALVIIEILILIFTFCSSFRYKFNGVLLNNKSDATNNYIYISISTAVLLFFGSFRGAFTEDYANYANLFQYLGKQDIVDFIFHSGDFHSEALFNIINKLIYMITENEIIMMAFFSCLTVLFFIFSIKNNSKNISMSIFMFISTGLYFNSFNVVRQILAASIVLWGGKYLYKNENIKFLFLILIAFLIHKTALIGIILIPLSNLNYSKKNIKFFLTICFILFLFCFTNIDKITIFFRSFLYNDYNEASYGMSNGTPITSLLLPIILIITVVSLRKYINVREQKTKVLLASLTLYVSFILLSLKIEMSVRFAYIFCMFLCALYPELFNELPSDKKKVYTLLFLLLLFLYSFGSAAAKLDYRFFWNV